MRIDQQLKKLYRDCWGTEFINKKLKQIKQIEQNHRQTKEEKQITKDVKEIIKGVEHFDLSGKPRKFFRFSHLYKALQKNGLKPADIQFITTAKGSGKTQEMAKVVSHILDNDPTAEIILLRNTEAELHGLDNDLHDDRWDISMSGRDNKLFHKSQTVNKKPRYVGFVTYVRGRNLESVQGPSYRNIRAILWDECNYTGQGFGINQQDLKRFIIFCSSIIRFNDNVKIYMFANYLPLASGISSNIIVEGFGVDPDTFYKRLEIPSEDGEHITTLDYWNLGGEYSGLKSQKFVGMFGSNIVKELAYNKPGRNNSRVTSILNFVKSYPLFAYVFLDGEEEKVLYLARHESKYGEQVIIKLEEYDHDQTYLFVCYTDNEGLYNKYSPRMLYIQEETLQQKLFYIRQACLSLRVWYVGNDSESKLCKYLTKWNKKYKLDYLSCGWC